MVSSAVASGAPPRKASVSEPRRQAPEPGGEDRPDVRPRDRSSGSEPAHTAGSVKGAPRPEQASGVSREEPRSTRDRLLGVQRAALFLPRVAWAVINAPLRGSVWVYNRYELGTWIGGGSGGGGGGDGRGFGLSPTILAETDHGLHGGARLSYWNLLGRGDQLGARAGYGGRFGHRYAARAASGDLLGDRVRLEAEGSYEERPRDQFFGIGNDDEGGGAGAPVDPYAEARAVSSRFRQAVTRVALAAEVSVGGPVTARLSGAVNQKTFDPADEDRISEGEQITDHYMVSALPGWERGVSYLYSELELRLDTRRVVSRFDVPAMASTGWVLSGYAGLARDLARAPTEYVRYGADLQRYLRLGERPRVLALRLTGEGVAGDLDEVPFTDLPRLGGPRLLRGYPRDRFRDRLLGLASAEYMFDLSQTYAGFLFVDAGRVYHSAEELELTGLRVGYGGGVQVYRSERVFARLAVASSIDGGLFFHLALDPGHEHGAGAEAR